MLSCPFLRSLSPATIQKEAPKLLNYIQFCPFSRRLFEKTNFATSSIPGLQNPVLNVSSPDPVNCGDISECNLVKCPYIGLKDMKQSQEQGSTDLLKIKPTSEIPPTCALFPGWQVENNGKTKSNSEVITPFKDLDVQASITRNNEASTEKETSFNYSEFFASQVELKKRDSTYRVFRRVLRDAKSFPFADEFSAGQLRRVAVWCSNDYLGLSWHPRVQEAAIQAIRDHGVGSGGTRNISGNTLLHESVEAEVADLHGKPAGLVFTSCYVANEATLHTLGTRVPGIVIISDGGNHASMIHGIRTSRAPKIIYRHNDVNQLTQIISQLPKSTPKLLAFETVHSMSGDVCPLESLLDVADSHHALTFVDEVHAVGLYGDRGAGVAERDNQMHRIDAITGTLGKAFASIGGYLVGSQELVDMIRSYASGFIFTTSLPPPVLAAAQTSIRILKSSEGHQLRERHQRRVRTVREHLRSEGLPVINCPSHIIPIHVGEAELCTRISQELLANYNIYIQSINFPTVAKGNERLRIAPSPHHTDLLTEQLVEALVTIWRRFDLPFLPSSRCGQADYNYHVTQLKAAPVVAA